MTKYTVMIYPQAIQELDAIYSYIAVQKASVDNATGQVQRIKKAILSLGAFPKSHQNRDQGKYAGKGYKQLLIDNYIAIYKIDDTSKTVYVVTIQYQGRNI